MGGALDQGVEAIEVEIDEIGGEPIGLALGEHERPAAAAVRDEVPAQDGDEGLQRAGRVLGQLLAPEQLREALGRDAVAARREQDLEHLLRPRATEIAGTEPTRADLDRERPEQPDHRPLAGSSHSSRRHVGIRGRGRRRPRQLSSAGNARGVTPAGR